MKVKNKHTGITCDVMEIGVLFVKLGMDGSVYKWVRIPRFKREWEEVK